MIPAPILLRKKEGMKIDLAHYSLGDEYIVTLSKTLESLPTFNTVNLCDNRLTDKGLHAIITTIVSTARITRAAGTRDACRAGVAHVPPHRLKVCMVEGIVDSVAFERIHLK